MHRILLQEFTIVYCYLAKSGLTLEKNWPVETKSEVVVIV